MSKSTKAHPQTSVNRPGQRLRGPSISQGVAEFGGYRPELSARRFTEAVGGFKSELDESLGIRVAKTSAQGGRKGHNNYKLSRITLATLVVAGGLAVKGGELVVDFIQNKHEENHLYDQTINPNALQEFQDGNIDKTKVVEVTAKEDSTAWVFAERLNPDGDPRKLSNEINAQSTSNGIPGVQNGETFVVTKSDVPNFPQGK